MVFFSSFQCQKNRGMEIMFDMMKEMRMGVGLSVLAQSSAAYLLAVNYAWERIQGKDLTDFVDKSAPSIPT